MKLKISEDRVKHFHLTEKKVFDLGYYRNKPENDTYVINTPNKLYYYNKVSGNKIIPWKTLDDCIDALLELSEINMLEDIIKKGITISRVTSDNYVVEEYSPEEVYDLANKFVRNMRNPMIADYFDESLKRNKSKRLREQNVEIEVKNKGILEVPEDKNVDDLPMSHFEKLVKKHGLSKITKALNNLQVWNKNDDKKLSKWAGDMIDKLTKKYGKNESISVKRFDEGWYNGDASISFTHNDDLEADLEEFLFDLFSDNPDVFEFDWSGKNTILYLACSEDDYKYIQRFIEDWKYKHRDEYDESLKEDYIDGVYVDIDSLSRRYRKMMQSGKLDDIISLYHEVGGDFDEFVIEAVQRGFSILDVMCFSVCNDGISINNFKHRLRMLGMLDENLKESGMYDYYDAPDGAFDMHNDMPTEEDEMWSELSTKQREIINALEDAGYNGGLTRFFNKIIGDWTKVYDTDKSTSSGVEITVDIDGKVQVQEFVYSADEEDLTDLSPVKIVKSAADVKKLDSWARRIKKHDFSL